MKKAARYFNTSGPNRMEEHYTLERQPLIDAGVQLVENERYFTIWAPRQSGKSTFIQLLGAQLEKRNYKIASVNLENFLHEPLHVTLHYLTRRMNLAWDTTLDSATFGTLFNDLSALPKDQKRILIIDEIEGLNPDLFHQFLHTIRNLYHSRDEHSLKCVVLVGVNNIVGIVQDNASPFNVTDNLEIPYFSNDETLELLNMHEQETGQLFAADVKEKISTITANQPGLVNGFANQLVTRHPDKERIDYADYLAVEDWYLTEAIDKNISNIVNKARQYRGFVETLLFTEEKQKFKINDEKIKFLHVHGLIKKDTDGYVQFWVPIYKKAVYDAFFPYTNGETKEQLKEINLDSFFMEDDSLNFDRLVEGYRAYVRRRGFRYFREKDERGQWKQIKEAAMVYSFESFIQVLLQVLGGKSYLEAHTGQGRSDLLINIKGQETVLEFKIYRDKSQFQRGKHQVAHYCNSLSLTQCVYLVFVSNVYKELGIQDDTQQINGVTVRTYIVYFDEQKDF